MRIVLISIALLVASVVSGQQSQVKIVSPDSLFFEVGIDVLGIKDTANTTYMFEADAQELEVELTILDSIGGMCISTIEVPEFQIVSYQILQVGEKCLLTYFSSQDMQRLDSLVVQPSETVVRTSLTDALETFSDEPGTFGAESLGPCSNLGSRGQFTQLLNNLDEIFFEKGRLANAIDFVEMFPVSTQDLRALCLKLDYEDNRLKLIEAAKPKVCDPGRLEMLDDLFVLSSSKNKLQRLVRD